MTGSDDGTQRKISPVDDAYVLNLSALSRDLDVVEELAAAALRGDRLDQAAGNRLAAAPPALTYTELSKGNAERQLAEDWPAVALADILDPEALAQLEAWRGAHRLTWDASDLAVVGTAGLVGALANLFDLQVDAAVLDGLAWLKKSDLLRAWEKDAARLPIDHTGPNFGGPAHRVRSAGHDIGRFFNALNQIRTGTFEGVLWEDGQRMLTEVTTTPSGRPFAYEPDPHLALVLLVKHWAADFVTPMSLPLPGWSLLAEMPNRDLRKFAHDAYAGSNAGDGLNLRSGALSPGLGMMATELIVRTHLHLAAYRDSGSPRLGQQAADKRTEMLLAAHAAAGAVSLSKTAAAAVAGEAAMAARHLNVPVLTRVGALALQVRSDRARRAGAMPPSWTSLFEVGAATWTLPEAVAIADLLQSAEKRTADKGVPLPDPAQGAL